MPLRPDKLDELIRTTSEQFERKVAYWEKNKSRLCRGWLWWFVYPIVTLVLSFMVYAINTPEVNIESDDTISIIIFSFIFGFLLKYLFQLLIELSIDSRISKITNEYIKLKTDSLKSGSDFFTSLVDINLKHLDQYYLQTQNQANKSFTLALFSASGGFVMILIGIYVMYQGKQDSGVLAASAGVISEFVSAIIFYLYNKTSISMANYHTKLVLTQNISLAFKASDSLPEDKRSETIQSLIKELTLNTNSYLAGGNVEKT